MLPMPVTLRDVLSIDAVRAADPLVVHGVHLLDREVRWVHTSELAEAAALLRGGELLLTTGLGLVGRGPVAQSSYVDQLADRAVAAMALELGWSFSDVPEPLLLAAQRRDLPLLALRKLVPFVEITEAVQTEILAGELTALRAERTARAVLDEVMAAGGGLTELVTAIAAFVDVPVAVESEGGQLIAQHGLAGGRAASQVDQRHGTTTSIAVKGARWGWLHVLDVTATAQPKVDAIRHHAAAAIGLVLARDHHHGPLRTSLARALLADLAEGRLDNPADALSRAAIVEPALAASSSIAAVAVVDDTEQADAALYAAGTALSELGPNVAAVVDGTLLALVAVRGATHVSAIATDLHQRLTELLRLRSSTSTPVLVAGLGRVGMVDTGQLLAEVRESAKLATDLGIRGQAITADTYSGMRLLDRIAHDKDAGRLIETQLGELLRYDSQHGTALVATLLAYLQHAGSKVDLADALHLRRQTLYQRLAKLEELLGDINQPDRRTTLLLALQLHQIRTARATSGVPHGRNG